MSTNNVVRLKSASNRAAGFGAERASDMFREISNPGNAVSAKGARLYREFRKAFNELAEDDARLAYLDTIDRAITAKASDTGGWASLYEAADFMREHDEFWQELGFASFEAYWRDRMGGYFASWREFEVAYNYAIIACPELFNIDWSEASQRAQYIARLRQISPAASHGGSRTHTGQYPTKDDATSRVIEAGDWVHKGGESFEYRVSKIKRDNPGVFDRMVSGEFFKTTKTGVVMIDLKAAEEEAGTNKLKPKPQKEVMARARQIVSSIKRQLKQNNTSQRLFIDELLNIPWVVKALKAKGWRRDGE